MSAPVSVEISIVFYLIAAVVCRSIPSTNTIRDMFKRKVNTSPAVKKKGQLDNQSRTFGVPLEDLVQRSDGELPFIVVKICEFLTDSALDLEGIFRVNGNSRIIENLRQSFDALPDVDLEQFNDCYAIAGLLKLFLRELPCGLIPESSTIDFTEIIDTYKDDLDSCLSEMEALLSGLPVDNYNLLKYLCQFLLKIAENEFDNKMSPTSLGIVFGPNVFRCGRDFEGLRNQGATNRIMSLFIEYFPSLFKMAAPSHANIIQVKEYNSRDHHHQKILPPKSSGNPRSEDNSMESPRPKPRLSLQVPTGNDVRFSTRISDEDFRGGGSPSFSMDTENDWSLVSPRVSVDLSSGLQQAIRQCVTEHLFGSLLATASITTAAPPALTTSAASVMLPHVTVDEDEATVSGGSDSVAPTPSPRLVRPVNGSATLPDRRSSGQPSSNSSLQIHQQNNHPTSSGYSSATLPHDAMHVDDLDWPAHHHQQQQPGRRERRHSAEIMDAADNNTTNHESPKPVGSGNKVNTSSTRPRAVSRKPKLAFQDTSADELSVGLDSTGQNVPILDLVSGFGHNDLLNSHSPQGDGGQAFKIINTQDEHSDALRTTTKLIQHLKRNIRQFEESFELEHGCKPGQSEKNDIDEVRQWMQQLTEARRQLKAIKSGGNTTQSGGSTTTLPVTSVGGGGSCPNSTRPLSAVSDLSASGCGGGVAGRPTLQQQQHKSMPATAEEDEDDRGSGVGEPVVREGQTVEDTFERLLTRLAEKRKQAGRGDVLATMTRDQIEAEKLAIQKALLYFESYHGRPNNRHEKLVMKPLYDRYRVVKRLLQGDSTPTTGDRGGIDSGDTIQRSATTGGRHVINIPTAGGGGGGTMDFMVTQDWNLLRGDRHFEVNTASQQQQHQREGAIGGSLVRLTGHEEQSAAATGVNSRSRTLNPRGAQTMGGTPAITAANTPAAVDISNKSVAELVEDQKVVREEKRYLQKVLKDFEHDFQKETGHKVNSEDRLPMRSEYNRYKQIKARLKLIETLLSKKSTI